MWAFPLVFVGFAILAGLWPFHTWAPTGHVAAPTAASMLLAGVVMKLGAYGCLRVAMTLFPLGLGPWGFHVLGLGSWRDVFAVLAVIGIVYGAMVALVQKDFKFVIGYSSVSHMGFILLGLMTLNQIGLSGAVVQMFSHGILAGLIFAVVGRMVYDRTHTRELALLGPMNLNKAIPFAAVTFVVAGMASMGLPGFSGFVAELMIVIGVWHSYPLLTICVGLGLVVGVAYIWRAMQKAFFAEAGHAPADAPRSASAHHASGTARRHHPDRRQRHRRFVSANAVEHHCPRAEFADVSRPAPRGLAMSPVNYAQLWQLALPQVIVVVAALIALAVDLLLLRARPTHTRFTVAALLGSLGCVLAIARIVLSPSQANVLDGTLLANPLTHLVQIALLVLAIVTLLMATNSRFTHHVGEFVLLILVATVGSMFLVSSQDLLVIFISLELLSLSLYILTALRQASPALF